MNKKYLLYVVIPAITVAATGIITVSTVSADSTAKMGNHMANMVTVIAQKFNLNPSDVQQVFDEQRFQQQVQIKDKMAQMQTQMQQKFTDNINKAVTDGKLTQYQANLIIAKKAELDAQKTNLQGKTKEEISTIMKTQSDSLKQWATDNNIPIQYLMFGGMGRGFGQQRMGRPDSY